MYQQKRFKTLLIYEKKDIALFSLLSNQPNEQFLFIAERQINNLYKFQQHKLLHHHPLNQQITAAYKAKQTLIQQYCQISPEQKAEIICQHKIKICQSQQSANIDIIFYFKQIIIFRQRNLFMIHKLEVSSSKNSIQVQYNYNVQQCILYKNGINPFRACQTHKINKKIHNLFVDKRFEMELIIDSSTRQIIKITCRGYHYQQILLNVILIIKNGPCYKEDILQILQYYLSLDDIFESYGEEEALNPKL